MGIIVYKSEVEAGLAKAIQSSNCVAYDSLAKKATPTKVDTSKFSFANKTINLQDEDLYFLDAILASVGLNANDDYFLKEETWGARNTPVHKQFNYMHNQTDIIGHIFASNVFDIDSNLIPDDSSFDDVPDFFDIVTSSVLYTAWPQEDLQERMDKIVSEIPQNKWFVSMECLFRGFDYALSSNNTINIIERKKETAFLTKYLRAFGGSGEYNGQKLSRVLRRYSFNGKGLVEAPANKRSIIFDNIERLKTYSIAFNGENTNMNKEITAATELKTVEGVDFPAMLAKANEENDKLRKALEDKSQAELASAKAKFDADLTVATELAQAKDKEIQMLQAQVGEVIAKFKDSQKNLDEANTTIASIKEENKKQERINKLVQAGVKEGVNDIVTKWSSASDEQFNDIVNLYSESKKADKKEDKKDESDEEESAEAAAKAIEDNKVEKDAKDIALASNQNADDEEKRLMASASQWLGSVLNSTKKNKGE